MPENLFGLDFGTTNSLAALVVGDEVRSLTENDRPLPSVIWYRGERVVVGREARQRLDASEGAVAQEIVRSPKMLLRRDGPIYVDGRPVEPVDAVYQVLKHVRDHAARQRPGYRISRAVMTIPVDFGGPQRRALREAARKADIGVIQFVHEPAAALYAFVRAKPNYRRELAKLEGKNILVFDWGGGTLDLTLCRMLGGRLMQIASRGNNEVGGDRFDERLRNWVRDRYAENNSITNVVGSEQPGALAALLAKCELAKISLSSVKEWEIGVRDFLRTDGPKRDLVVQLTRRDLEEISQDFIRRGLGEIDAILEQAHLDRRDIELCLPTGGMVNMPAIQQGLRERFLSRVAELKNGDRIIAEGAAWIAHDGLRLTLAKPLEVLIADGSGRGAYLPLVDIDLKLPVENQTVPIPARRFYCIDPRDGFATFEFAKPRKVGIIQRSDDRETVASLNLPVDPKASPMLERIECEVQIDHDYVARIIARSKGRGERIETEFHQLDFGLALPSDSATGGGGTETGEGDQSGPRSPSGRSRVTLRSNIAESDDWRLVPGDIVERWRPNFGVVYSLDMTDSQRREKNYYELCSYCNRSSYEITAFGPIDTCRQHGCREGCPLG